MEDEIIPLVEEYRTLRHEIIERIKLQTQLEVLCITAASFVWAASFFPLFTNSPLWAALCAGLLIFAASHLGSCEATAIFNIAAYIAAKFETRAPRGPSWESLVYSKAMKKGPSSPSRHALYYGLLMIMNLLIAFARLSSAPSSSGSTIDFRIVFGLLTAIALSILIPIVRVRKCYLSKADQISEWKAALYPRDELAELRSSIDSSKLAGADLGAPKP